MWAAPVVDAIIHTDTQLSMLQILHYEGIERDRSEFVLEGGSIHVDGEGCASLNCSIDWSMDELTGARQRRTRNSCAGSTWASTACSSTPAEPCAA